MQRDSSSKRLALWLSAVALGIATTGVAQENIRQIRERSAIASPIDNPLNPND